MEETNQQLIKALIAATEKGELAWVAGMWIDMNFAVGHYQMDWADLHVRIGRRGGNISMLEDNTFLLRAIAGSRVLANIEGTGVADLYAIVDRRFKAVDLDSWIARLERV